MNGNTNSLGFKKKKEVEEERKREKQNNKTERTTEQYQNLTIAAEQHIIDK